MSQSRTEVLPGTCEVGKCENIAEWVPVILVYPLGYPKHKVRPMEVEMQMGVCDHHRVILSPGDLMNEDAWDLVTGVLARRRGLLPDREGLELRFTRIPQPGDTNKPHGLVH
jgi:hypothetical protein